MTLTVPLTAGGLIASQVREAEDRNGSDRLKIEATRRDVDRSVAAAWNQMVTADRQVLLQNEQRRFAETQLDGMINEYRAGLRSTFDVLYAQQSLRDAELALLATQRDRYVSGAALLRHTGQLEVKAVLAGVQLHDPLKHLRDIEHRNAVPWEALFASLDKAGAPKGRQRPLLLPAKRNAIPMIVARKSGPEVERGLARSLPMVPLAGSAGRPDANLNQRMQ